jgi:membrane protein CcdC involved in cytochrome C biogenesis
MIYDITKLLALTWVVICLIGIPWGIINYFKDKKHSHQLYNPFEKKEK